ncbi:MAG: GNAT family N-acetyltransferase [Candidatus Thorarchaeota archaeon]|nr:MAG: GNAT family N-acetyltransferase [Candidatus Thorarchaeota archaeon]
MIIEVSENREIFRPMFERHRMGRSVLFQCFDMGLGSIKTDSKEAPTVALYSFRPFNYVVGDSSSPSAPVLVKSIPAMNIVLTPNEEWTKVVKSEWGDDLIPMDRTLLNADTLDLGHIRELKTNLSDDFKVAQLSLTDIEDIDNRHIMQIEMIWGSLEEFEDKNIGFCIKHGETAVSMAYPAFPYNDEFEIQVATLDSLEYRRKGLATAVSAALIEYALENELVPQWDAANEQSVGLALKLGYTNPEAYQVYLRRSK